MKMLLALVIFGSFFMNSVHAEEVELTQNDRINPLRIIKVKASPRGRSNWVDVSAVAAFSNPCHAEMSRNVKFLSQMIRSHFTISLVSVPDLEGPNACTTEYNPIEVTFKIPVVLPILEGRPLRISVNGVEVSH